MVAEGLGLENSSETRLDLSLGAWAEAFAPQWGRFRGQLSVDGLGPPGRQSFSGSHDKRGGIGGSEPCTHLQAQYLAGKAVQPGLLAVSALRPPRLSKSMSAMRRTRTSPSLPITTTLSP